MSRGEAKALWAADTPLLPLMGMEPVREVGRERDGVTGMQVRKVGI